MAKRIFIAIPATREIRAQVAEFHRRHGELNARWIKPQNLHITLVPPFYLVPSLFGQPREAAKDEERQLANLIQKLNTLSCQPFTIAFDRVSPGPNLRKPRLIWAVGRTPPELLALKLKIEKVLKPLVNITHGRELYKLHMTIARCPQPYSSASGGETCSPAGQKPQQSALQAQKKWSRNSHVWPKTGHLPGILPEAHDLRQANSRKITNELIANHPRQSNSAEEQKLMGYRSHWNIKWSMPVDRYVLYESHLRPEGAEYEVLQEFPF